MVLCQYYLNDSCRFGSKCNNEHFDIKQLIKTEVEAAFNGKQWPISCFGPFKEKPCLQNFIADQSFEEIRHLCYEAKNQNNFPAFAQQFSEQVIDAQNRMKALLSLNRDVLLAVVNVYNSNADLNTNQQNTKAGNPFSLGGGGFAVAQSSNAASSIFGSSSVQQNPFSNSSFGAGPQQNTASVFGGTQTTNSSGGLFNQPTYGSANNAFGSPKPSIFGGANQSQQSNAFGTNQFGASTQHGNQAATPFGINISTNAFGVPPANTFGSSGPAQTTIFGQQASQVHQTNVFGQQQQQSQIQSTNLPFGQPAQQLQQNTVFNSPQQQQQPKFGQPSIQNPSVFSNVLTSGQVQGNLFAQHQPQMQIQQLVQAEYATPVQASENVFGSSQQHQAASLGGSLLGTQQVTNVFQQNPTQQRVAGNAFTDNISDTAYSRMEGLSPENLDAFRSTNFVLGKIPTVPPPKELCQ